MKRKTVLILIAAGILLCAYLFYQYPLKHMLCKKTVEAYQAAQGVQQADILTMEYVRPAKQGDYNVFVTYQSDPLYQYIYTYTLMDRRSGKVHWNTVSVQVVDFQYGTYLDLAESHAKYRPVQ